MVQLTNKVESERFSGNFFRAGLILEACIIPLSVKNQQCNLPMNQLFARFAKA
jgi:hypothetical protein